MLEEGIFQGDALRPRGGPKRIGERAGEKGKTRQRQGPKPQVKRGPSSVWSVAEKQYQAGKTQPGYTWPGIIAGLGENNGKNPTAYVNLAAKIVATGAPGISGAVASALGFSGQGSIQDLLLQTGGGDAASAELAALDIDAKINVMLLSINGADKALGPADPFLIGAFSIVSDLCEVFGNLVTAYVQTELSYSGGTFTTFNICSSYCNALPFDINDAEQIVGVATVPEPPYFLTLVTSLLFVAGFLLLRRDTAGKAPRL